MKPSNALSTAEKRQKFAAKHHGIYEIFPFEIPQEKKPNTAKYRKPPCPPQNLFLHNLKSKKRLECDNVIKIRINIKCCGILLTPLRWFKQIKRNVSFDVTTRFNAIQRSTAMYNSHIFDGRNTTIKVTKRSTISDQL